MSLLTLSALGEHLAERSSRARAPECWAGPPGQPAPALALQVVAGELTSRGLSDLYAYRTYTQNLVSVAFL